MKGEGKGDSNEFLIKNEVNRHREKHHEGLAAQKISRKKIRAGLISDSPTVYRRMKTIRNNSKKAKQNKTAHVTTVQVH